MRATKVRLGGLVVAAIGGGFSASVGSFDVFGSAALVALVAAVAAEVHILSAQPDRLWYEGRAAAESTKTLAWRYMVAGEPFPRSLPGDQVDDVFFGRLREVLQDLGELDLVPDDAPDGQLPAGMKEVRALDLPSRQREYRRGRIDGQRSWYRRKAAWNRQRSQRWSLVTIALEACGILVASAKAFGIIDFDLLGLIAAAAAAMTAWSQARQYGLLSHAYVVASQELATISSMAERSFTEPEWARFVDEAEEAISREHTLWRASLGTRRRAHP